MNSYLDPTQIQFYQEHGYLHLPAYADHVDIDHLRQQAQNIMTQFEAEERTVFSTQAQRHTSDRYFLESGDQIRCFFEEDAFDAEGQIQVPLEKAINKIGHAMHDLLPEFQRFSYRSELLSIARTLGMQRPSIVQSQYICKQARIGGVVRAHTDSTFIYSEPLSCLGVWIALEKAHEQNGCLLVLPGSHRAYPLQERFVRNAETGTKFVETTAERVTWPEEKLIPIPAAKGDLILLHGSLVHASSANRSEHSRHAYVLHLIDLACHWPKDNWLQRRTQLPFQDMESVV